MTRADFTAAIGRYCTSQRNSNARPNIVVHNKAALHDFLREVEQDMRDHPELFKDPGWSIPRACAPHPSDAAPTTRDPATPATHTEGRRVLHAGNLHYLITRCDDCPILHPEHNYIMPVCGVLRLVNGLSDRCVLPGCPLGTEGDPNGESQPRP